MISLAIKYNLKTEEVKLSRMINSRNAKMWETIKDTSDCTVSGHAGDELLESANLLR
jgi:hypothetical protein